MIINLSLCDLHLSYFKEKYKNLDISIVRYNLKCDVKDCYTFSYNKVSVDLDSEIKKITNNKSFLNYLRRH
jgi:hypothetical protein